MRHDVIVQFDAQRQVELTVDSEQLPDALAAKAWLDSEFTRMECEPLRASGKLLTADKLLVLAQEAGLSGLQDADWGPRFAAAALAVLQRPLLRIDLTQMRVSH